MAMIERDDLAATEALVSGFSPPDFPSPPATDAALANADQISRAWTSDHVGPLRPGSGEHKREVCRMFRETFNPYRPSVIAWPKLRSEELQRLTSLPIWDIAVHTEGRARLRFAAYARSVADGDMQAAIMLNAWEENRHKEVLSKLVEAYGIPLAPEPAYEYPSDVERAYLFTGYSECIDSFFAFGLFELARQSGFFPPELVETFEPVMQEECRHILLFANWLAWHRASLPRWRRPFFEARVAAVWVAIARDRIGMARGIGTKENAPHDNSNFTVKGASALSPIEFGARDLMQLCLQENDRRFAGYDSRLVRPTTVPALIRLALFVSRPWARKRARRRLQPAD
jgi:hypothetical protein